MAGGRTRESKRVRKKKKKRIGRQKERGEDMVRKQSVVEPAAGTVRNELAVL